MKINGVDMKQYFLVYSEKRMQSAPISINEEVISGVDGSLFRKRQRDSYDVEIKFMLKQTPSGKTVDQYIRETILPLICFEEPVPIVFDSDTSVTMYGILKGNIDISSDFRYGGGTLTFHFSDIGKYGKSRSYSSSPSGIQGYMYYGTMKGYPKFTFEGSFSGATIKIWNITLGKNIQVTLPSGQTFIKVIVDCEEMHVELYKSSTNHVSGDPYLTLSSEYFCMNPVDMFSIQCSHAYTIEWVEKWL